MCDVQAKAACTDNDGSFTCACNTGYGTTNKGVLCTDTNECQTGVDTCDKTFGTCTNTAGSFTCTCNSGYTTDDNGVTCTDVIECGVSDTCDALNAICSDGGGSFACTCKPGYSTSNDGVECNDIDECGTGVDNCDSTRATCTNIAGSFTCACNSGYTTNNEGITCTDINECVVDNKCDPTNGFCANTPGSFTCTCNEGFTDNDGVTCTFCGTSDTCDTANAACADVDGSFTCTCNAGFKTTNNGMACFDANECAGSELNSCDSNAFCTNTVGSYTCLCQSGFSGNGVDCETASSTKLVAEVAVGLPITEVIHVIQFVALEESERLQVPRCVTPFLHQEEFTQDMQENVVASIADVSNVTTAEVYIAPYHCLQPLPSAIALNQTDLKWIQVVDAGFRRTLPIFSFFPVSQSPLLTARLVQVAITAITPITITRRYLLADGASPCSEKPHDLHRENVGLRMQDDTCSILVHSRERCQTNGVVGSHNLKGSAFSAATHGAFGCPAQVSV